MFNRNRRPVGPRRFGSSSPSKFGNNGSRFRQFSQGRGRYGNKFVSYDMVQRYIERASAKKDITITEVEETRSFSVLPLQSRLKENIKARGYEKMTPIQDKAISQILENRDVIGIANTGTGKTGAFLIPIIERIAKDSSYKALVIVPTRELAIQIRDELQHFSANMSIYSTVCIGKSSMYSQKQQLRRNPHVVIGTPGRLKDLIERKDLNLSMFRIVVLDEVDRMLDMGFVEDVRHIIGFLPPVRQSLFFSATVSSQINSLIQSFVKNPVSISVKNQETTNHIEQKVMRASGEAAKIELLHSLLSKEEFGKVLIFGRTKRNVDKLTKALFEKGYKTASIHGDKPQANRQRAIQMFKQDEVKILVATDVAARGLDIANITHVINFDAPETFEDYVHRIGRTGRADKLGIAVTFV